jgi:hypothetical protein
MEYFFFLLNQQNKIKRKVNKRKNIIKPTFEQKQTKKKKWVKMIYKLHAIKTVNFCAVGVDCTQDCFLTYLSKNVAQAENHIAVAEGQQQQQNCV